MGPAWQWENNEKGFHSYDLSTKVFSHYEFVFSEAYDFAQIYPHVKTFFGSVRIPKDVLSFTLTRQNPPAGACPPAAGATKQEISRCAMWRRDSTFFKVVPGLSDAIGTFVYYAYQIVDNERRPSADLFFLQTSRSMPTAEADGLSRSEGTPQRLVDTFLS